MKKQIPVKYGVFTAIVGAVMMALGVCLGETEAVLAKAIKICLECIGIG